jgi:hypothetical protein
VIHAHAATRYNRIVMADYNELLRQVLTRSRNDALLNVVLGVTIVPLNLLLLWPAWWALAICGLLTVQTAFALRRRFRLRAGSPIVKALEQPATLDRARAWPPLAPDKYPPGHIPQILQVFVGGRECKLRLDKAIAQPFIAALREQAPAIPLEVPLLPKATARDA